MKRWTNSGKSDLCGSPNSFAAAARYGAGPGPGCGRRLVVAADSTIVGRACGIAPPRLVAGGNDRVGDDCCGSDDDAQTTLCRHLVQRADNPELATFAL